ncbi:MAG: SPASM domain-containing protein, partial [Treponema sp.]|nr:SPASM domain-containing protein [Treponema sp.]
GMAMLAVDNKGYLYPCIRFSQFSLENKEPRIVGTVENGLNFNKLRPFMAITRLSQSKSECVKCDVASGCAWCTGANYDNAQTNTIYERATYICKMHKARVRANNYYQSRIKEIGVATHA